MNAARITWAPLGETTLERFLAIREQLSAASKQTGEAFLVCSHSTDLSESTREIQKHLSKTLRAIERPGFTLLLSIYGPFERRGVPAIIRKWMDWRGWNGTRRFYCPPVMNATEAEGFVETWFTCEGDASAVTTILKEHREIAWGSGLALGGFQVSRNEIGKAIKSNLFVPDSIRPIADHGRLAFTLNNDITELELFVRSRFVTEVTKALGIQR